MDFFAKLEFNRLIKELDFINSDLFYKSSLLKVADEIFIKDVDVVLTAHPQLKSILDDKKKKRMEFFNTQPQVDQPIEQISEQIENDLEIDLPTENKDPRIKKLYRQIARSTHPDVATQANLQEVYLDAQKAYDSNDLVQILSICEKLKIEYEISEAEFNLIKEEINLKRKRIEFLESTYTWKWYHIESIEEKNQIILNYLETQISR